MLALLNILLLFSPISQGSSEIGTNIEIGNSSETVDSRNQVFDSYFFEDNASGSGYLNGINLYYNYFLTDNFYIGIESNYLFYSSQLIKTENELINIDGNEAEGEFEHVFESDSKRLLSAINFGYNFYNNFYFSIGLTYNNSISGINISSFEKISKPENAGVFIEEQSRIRDMRDTNITTISPVFGLLPALNIKLPMNSENSLFLNGRVGYNYNFNSFTNDDIEFNSNSLIMSLGISYVANNSTIYKVSTEEEIISNVISFELIDRIERSTEVFNFDVIKYIDLESGRTTYANYSNGQSIVLYVQLDNLEKKKVEFSLSTDSISIFEKVLTEKLTKISVPKVLVDTKYRPKDLIINLSYKGNIIDQKIFATQYNILHELSYLYSSNISDLSKYIDINNERILTIYTDEDSIYSFLDSTRVSNVTVRGFEELEFNLENTNKDKYLLIIE
ncbi:MAG: autotransporter outer membrane beta-barrel domain-containing protein [Chlorobiota bacterium]